MGFYFLSIIFISVHIMFVWRWYMYKRKLILEAREEMRTPLLK